MKPSELHVPSKDVLRKDKPLPPSKPPARPPAPTGVRVPGTSGSPGGMICSGLDLG